MLKNLLSRALSNVITNAGMKAVQKTVLGGGKEKTISFTALPATLEEFKALPEAALTDEFAVAALSLLALTQFEADHERCFAMLDFLKGPDPLSGMQKQFLAERFMDGSFYKVNSFFEGATPANGYTPSQPYKVRVSSNPYSYQNEGWATLYLHSGGADSPRPVILRKKPSTGTWHLVEIQYLSDVRVPAAADKWR